MRKTDVWKIGKKTIVAIVVFAMVFSVFVGMNAQNVGAVNVGKGIRNPEAVNVTAGTTPTIDGVLDTGEWADAVSVSLTGAGDAFATAYLKHDGMKLYIGFDMQDSSVEDSDYVQVILDPAHDENPDNPQTDDMKMTKYRDDSASENTGTGDGWSPTNSSTTWWVGKSASTTTAWSAEYAIDYSELGIVAETAKIMGIMLSAKDASAYYHTWPTDADHYKPSTWEDAFSSDNWYKAPPTGWLAGYTVDIDSNPVSFISVVMYGGEGKYYSTTSGFDGYYNITAFLGDYSVLGIDYATSNLSDTLTATIEENIATDLNITLHPAPPMESGGIATFKDEFANITTDSFFTMTMPLYSIEFLGIMGIIPGINADGYINDTEAGLAEESYADMMTPPVADEPIPGFWIDDTQYLYVNNTWDVTVDIPTGNVTEIVTIMGTMKANYTNTAVNVSKNEHVINMTAEFDNEAMVSSSSCILPEGWRMDVYDASTPNVTITGWTTITIDPLMDSNLTDDITNETISISVVKDVTPPAAVTGLGSGVTDTDSVTLTWTGVTDEDFDHYKVYWDDAEITDLETVTQTATTEDTTYIVTPLAHGYWYFAVTTVDALGNENTVLVTESALINQAPVANFTISPVAPYYRSTVITFTNTSTDPDGNADIVNYTWNISGVIKYGLEVTHTFTALGTFNVTLTVKDIYDATDEKTLSVTIVNQAPTASFTVSATEVKVGVEIEFTSTSTDPESDTLTYLWTFGDGETSIEANPKHTYDSAGTYEVTLKVTDAYDAEHTSTATTITIKAATITEPTTGAIITAQYTGTGNVSAASASSPGAAPSGKVGIGKFVEVTAPATLNITWVYIKIPYTAADIPAGANESSLKMYYWTGSEWAVCTNTGVDTVNKFVWANVTHLTIFAPMAESAAVTPTTPVNWALYGGVVAVI
ncbi:MAG: PKD domain-containing protein, partial [Thermoplasmatales archaeon]|nr:PKD domain-containing protein [Thermoplasmatales archaeon]